MPYIKKTPEFEKMEEFSKKIPAPLSWLIPDPYNPTSYLIPVGGLAKLRSPKINLLSRMEKVPIEKLEPSHPILITSPPSRTFGPIKIYRDLETGLQTIIDGHHRVREAQEQGKKVINAFIDYIKTDPTEPGIAYEVPATRKLRLGKER